MIFSCGPKCILLLPEIWEYDVAIQLSWPWGSGPQIAMAWELGSGVSPDGGPKKIASDIGIYTLPENTLVCKQDGPPNFSTMLRRDAVSLAVPILRAHTHTRMGEHLKTSGNKKLSGFKQSDDHLPPIMGI